MFFPLIMSAVLALSHSQPEKPLTLIADGHDIITIPREKMALLSVPGSAFPNQQFIEDLIEKIDKGVSYPPEDAKFGKNGGIISEKPGADLNSGKMEEILLTYFYTGAPIRAEVPLRSVYPRVDSELLDQIHSMLIGRYTTFFNSGNKERSNNIGLAAKTLDNKVVFPGETFSFNKTIGKRTAARGYEKAPIIVRGELSEGIGGGICQVSSTLFNAVDHAGLKILQRYSHTKAVTYVPAGRDATVSWYGPDFTFRNIYSQPILIRAKSLGSTLSVSIYSVEHINYRPRSIPGAPAILPKETHFHEPKEQPGN